MGSSGGTREVSLKTTTASLISVIVMLIVTDISRLVFAGMVTVSVSATLVSLNPVLISSNSPSIFCTREVVSASVSPEEMSGFLWDASVSVPLMTIDQLLSMGIVAGKSVFSKLELNLLSSAAPPTRTPCIDSMISIWPKTSSKLNRLISIVVSPSADSIVLATKFHDAPIICCSEDDGIDTILGESAMLTTLPFRNSPTGMGSVIETVTPENTSEIFGGVISVEASCVRFRGILRKSSLTESFGKSPLNWMKSESPAV